LVIASVSVAVFVRSHPNERWRIEFAPRLKVVVEKAITAAASIVHWAPSFRGMILPQRQGGAMPFPVAL
jgi:hypothetical protein